MERRKTRRKSKAISPIIATLILIVITVVAGVMLYGFVTGFMTKTSSSTGAISQIAIASAGVSYNGKNATIILTNTGTASVTITRVNLLNATTGAPLATFKYISTSPITSSTKSTSVAVAGSNTTTIYAGFGATTTVTMPSQGKTVLVQVITNTGSYAETSVVVGP